jgi:hypothetical protein
VTKARQLLKFEPSVTLQQGLPSLLNWVKTQAAQDGFDQVEKALLSKALMS